MSNSTNKAKNMSKLSWTVNGLRAKFQSQRCYGVINSAGQALSNDGISPAVWGSLKVAKEIALYCDGFTGYSWIDVFEV